MATFYSEDVIRRIQEKAQELVQEMTDSFRTGQEAVTARGQAYSEGKSMGLAVGIAKLNELEQWATELASLPF